MNLCQYKDAFGKPGEGVHSLRVGPFALVDILAVVIVALVLRVMFTGWSIFWILIVLFILGIVAHRMFCVRTALDKMIFK